MDTSRNERPWYEATPRRMWVSFVALVVLTASSLVLVGQRASGGAVTTVREGVVRVLAADTIGGHDHADPSSAKDGTDHYRAVLVTDPGDVLFLAGAAQYPVNRRVRITGTEAHGVLRAQRIERASGPPGEAQAGPAGLTTDGTTNVLVMLAYWTSPDGVTPASAAAQMFGDSNAWYRDNSYGALGQQGDVTPWMRIDPPAGNHCFAESGAIMEQARAAAAALGYDPDTYDNTVVYFPFDGTAGSDCADYAGWAFVGAPSVWLNGFMDRRVTTHEQGHNYGLWHAHSLLCPGTLDTSCALSDYGNPYDAMGSSGYVGHFSASQKAKLGWMGGRVADLTGGGTATLVPYEADDPATVAATVRADGDRSYWLEYRQPRDFDAGLPPSGTDGVLLTVQDPTLAGDDGASLLDSRPGDGLGVDSATLRTGESWISDEGIGVQVLSATPDGATIAVGHVTTGTVSGVVRDAGGSPLRGTRVTVDGDHGATTDGTGHYTVEGVPVGSHTVRAEHVCLAPADRSVTTGDADTTADFALTAPPDAPCELDAAGWDGVADLLSLQGDDEVAPVALPFPVRHHGQEYTTAYVSTNGLLAFQASDAAYVNTGLPDASPPNATIAAFWDDLVVDDAASIRAGTLGTAPNRRFVVEWRDATFYAAGDHRVTVQLALPENPSDAVRLRYRDLDGSVIEAGGSATVGTEDAAGTTGRQVSFDEPVLYDGLAIRLGGEVPPSVSIGDATVAEGARGTRNLRFTVSLSRPAGERVRVAYRTVGRTATAGDDFVAVRGAVTIPAGRVQATIAVPVRGDRRVEPREFFRVDLRDPSGARLGRARGFGRIRDDDPSSGLRVTVGDASLVEGDAGTRNLRFTVALSRPVGSRVRVGYLTRPGTARAGVDFGMRLGTVTIPAGATSAAVTVPVRPDTVPERTEAFSVRLGAPDRGRVADAVGIGRILDDE